jgi:hypothetical protein
MQKKESLTANVVAACYCVGTYIIKPGNPDCYRGQIELIMMKITTKAD